MQKISRQQHPKQNQEKELMNHEGTMNWTPLCGVDSSCLLTDRVGGHTAVDAFILMVDLKREAEICGDICAAGPV